MGENLKLLFVMVKMGMIIEEGAIIRILAFCFFMMVRVVHLVLELKKVPQIIEMLLISFFY